MRFLTIVMFAAVMPLAGAAQSGGFTGEQLFQFYCTACHGQAADGKGPMRPILLVQPTDLTLLAADNGGTFPTWRVVRRIDGRDPLVSHGSDMPVFGPLFDGGEYEAMATDDAQPILASRTVIDLVTYLQSIQKEDTK